MYHLVIFADLDQQWPDGADRAVTAVYLLVIFGLPLAGYVIMYFDFRRYLRSLRRALVVVANAIPATPYWALRSRPQCLKVLELTLPCSEAEVMAAYREKAKELHPDRGGDLEDFLRLQRYFEQALLLVRKESEMDDRAGIVRTS
ncbi:MAG: hypothetical protein AAGD11_13135 [Planctomycetota bacterium]